MATLLPRKFMKVIEMTKIDTRGEIFALTGLRFVAALYVFLFHIHIRWPLTDQKFLKNILDQGAIGMSLFFILSGFVLAYRYADGKTPIGPYLANRFARIYPIYAVAAILTLPWIGLSLGDGSIIDIGRAALQFLLLLIANILLIQAWFPQFFDYWNNGASWSIAVEAFCYMLLPFLLPYLVKLSPKRLLMVILLCYVLATIPGLVAFIYPNTPRGVYYSMPIFRLPEFLIGVCAFLAYQYGWGRYLKASYQWIFLALIFIYIGIAGPKIPNYVGHNWIVVPFIAFMILSLASGKGLIAKALSNPLSVWLGKISYSFYSFQAVVILSLISSHSWIVKILPILNNNLIFLVFAMTILVGISAAGYYIIEEPARKILRKKLKT